MNKKNVCKPQINHSFNLTEVRKKEKQQQFKHSMTKFVAIMSDAQCAIILNSNYQTKMIRFRCLCQTM